MTQTISLSVETVALPEPSDCHQFKINLPSKANVCSIDLVEENGKRKILFWLVRHNGNNQETTACDFYLLKKGATVRSLTYPTNKKIVPIMQFHHPLYLLIGIFNHTSGVDQCLTHPGLS